ncbi:sensor domain-containing protein [Tahibacter amnicola]|uniref:Sensor domain-containing protein n=1 Tax=Tahibacter amnicola TaxID=2976241 RepID=A0ABY6BCG9_9GAMM|nr:sensor domain-containing protein [Tahibacter amnicola]UXI66883.1 sensor domain-containing protein [Tahibacter amnicola]
MSQSMPRTINEYLEQLRYALRSEDPALIQDALYDAEDHLRSEFAENPNVPPAELLARIASSYGAPDEVADIYRDKERVVQSALKPPAPPVRTSALAKFFGVAADPRAWAATIYMLMAMPLGIFYFTWAVTGLSLSLGMMILVIGLPLTVLFLATVRVISLVEGRLVEVMLGERMPRRPIYAQRGLTLVERVKQLFTDTRTWTTLFYMTLMMPLGIVYFTTAVVGFTLGASLFLNPIVSLFWDIGLLNIDGEVFNLPLVLQPLQMILGIVLLFAMLHLARGVAKVQGAFAKHLLVQAG